MSMDFGLFGGAFEEVSPYEQPKYTGNEGNQEIYQSNTSVYDEVPTSMNPYEDKISRYNELWGQDELKRVRASSKKALNRSVITPS